MFCPHKEGKFPQCDCVNISSNSIYTHTTWLFVVVSSSSTDAVIINALSVKQNRNTDEDVQELVQLQIEDCAE